MIDRNWVKEQIDRWFRKPAPLTDFDLAEDYWGDTVVSPDKRVLSDLLNTNLVRVYSCFMERICQQGIQTMAGKKMAVLLDMTYIPDFDKHSHIGDVYGLIGTPQWIDLTFDPHLVGMGADKDLVFLAHNAYESSAVVIYDPLDQGGGLICWCPARASMTPGNTLTLAWPSSGLFTIK